MFFLQAASLYAFLRWLKTREPGWIAAGAAFLGSTLGIKHTALFGAVPLACFCGYALLRSRAKVRMWVLCGALFIVSGLYWDARTFFLTGNPAFPATAAQSVSVGIATPGRSLVDRLLRYAEVVWLVQFHGQAVFESPLPNPTGVALIVFLPMTFLLARSPGPARRACLAFSTVYLAYWLVTVAALRYALLPLALLTVLLIGKAIAFYDQTDIRAARASVVCALAGTLLFSVLGMAIIEVNGPMLMLLAKRIDGAAYLRSVLPAYGALEWLNRNPISGKVLAIDDSSRAYAPDPGQYRVVDRNGPDLPRRIEACACDFVVVPVGLLASGGQESLFGSLEVALQYRDTQFAVYRIKRRF